MNRYNGVMGTEINYKGKHNFLNFGNGFVEQMNLASIMVGSLVR